MLGILERLRDFFHPPPTAHKAHELGNLARDSEDYLSARLHYMYSWSKRLPASAYMLGLMRLQGEGLPIDYSEAGRYFEFAAAAGIREAQFNLARLHAQGLGVRQDWARANTLYKQAGTAGLAEAAKSLSVSYALGRGVERNEDEAAVWMQRAFEIEQGPLDGRLLKVEVRSRS